MLDFSLFQEFLLYKIFGKFMFLRSFDEQKIMGKCIWIHVSLQARDCCLNRSKRDDGGLCGCGLVQTGSKGKKLSIKYRN